MLGISIPAITILVAATAMLTALRAIRTSRTPQGAVGWVVFIFALPVLAIPVYLIFGNVDHRGYTEARQASDATVLKGDGADDDAAPPGRLVVFERLARRTARSGNGLDLLIDGEATYDAIFQAIDEAREYLLVQFYIVRNDQVGQRLKAALIEKARAGVRVYMLHNAISRMGLARGYERELREAGVQIHLMHGPRRLLGRLQINYRNHRKLVIADGRVALTGGLNIGEEHLGANPNYGPWRDTHARIRGPLVAQLQHDFVADWFWSSDENLAGQLNWQPGEDPRDLCGLILAPAPTDRLETGNLYFCALANAATRRLWIATPYFVPDFDVLSALKLAALRGVDVRILVPHRADHYLPWLAAFAYFDEVRQAGGEIWRYEAGFMHQKVVLVDDDLASVGTINLDIRSGLLNFEQTAIVESRETAREVERMLEADFARAFPMETSLGQRAAWLRVAAPASRLLAPLL